MKEARPEFWFSCSALFSHTPELSKRNNTQACLGKTEDRERSNQAVICVKVLCKRIITNILGGEEGRVYKMKSTGFRIKRPEHNCSLENVTSPL